MPLQSSGAGGPRRLTESAESRLRVDVCPASSLPPGARGADCWRYASNLVTQHVRFDDADRAASWSIMMNPISLFLAVVSLLVGAVLSRLVNPLFAPPFVLLALVFATALKMANS